MKKFLCRSLQKKMSKNEQPTVIGEPTQVELNGKRFYKVDFSNGASRYLRSVTTICKGAKLPSFLDTWEKDQIEQIGVKGFKEALDAKAHDGTLVHKFIEMHLNGDEVNRTSVAEIQSRINGEDKLATFGFDDDTWPMYQAYLAWEERRKPTLVWTEKTLYSLQYGYAGRSDGMMMIDGRKTIIDFKSAKRVQDDHKQQGCAYLMAASEMGEDVEQVLILCLGQDEKRKQLYSETILGNPYEIHQHFMGFYYKNQLVNWDSPILL